MPIVYLRRRPDGSPNTDGPSVRLPDDARYIHRQAGGWIARALPDMDADGAATLAYIEEVTPDIPGGWGDLLATFAGERGDRTGILQRRLKWLQSLDVQAVDRIGVKIVEIVNDSHLTKDELGN